MPRVATPKVEDLSRLEEANILRSRVGAEERLREVVSLPAVEPALPRNLKPQQLAAIVGYMRGLTKVEAYRSAGYRCREPQAAYEFFSRAVVKEAIRAFTEASFKCGLVSREAWIGEQEMFIQRAAADGKWSAVAMMRAKLAEVCGLTGPRGVEVTIGGRMSDVDIVNQLKRLVGDAVGDRVAIELGLVPGVVEGEAVEVAEAEDGE